MTDYKLTPEELRNVRNSVEIDGCNNLFQCMVFADEVARRAVDAQISKLLSSVETPEELEKEIKETLLHESDLMDIDDTSYQAGVNHDNIIESTTNHLILLFQRHTLAQVKKDLDPENGNDPRELCKTCAATIRKEERERIAELLSKMDAIEFDDIHYGGIDDIRKALKGEATE